MTGPATFFLDASRRIAKAKRPMLQDNHPPDAAGMCEMHRKKYGGKEQRCILLLRSKLNGRFFAHHTSVQRCVSIVP